MHTSTMSAQTVTSVKPLFCTRRFLSGLSVRRLLSAGRWLSWLSNWAD